MSVVHDLGLDGCAFQSNAAYSIGQPIELQIKLPGQDKLAQVLGEVKDCLWVIKDEALHHAIDLNGYRLRIHFLKMDAKISEYLAKIIEFNRKNQKD